MSNFEIIFIFLIKSFLDMTEILRTKDKVKILK